MYNDTTQHLGLPLPHEQNELENDLPRVRESLVLLDAALHVAQTTLDERAGEMAQEVRLAVRQALSKLRDETDTLITLVEESIDAQVLRMDASLHAVRILRLNQLLNLGI